MRKKKAEHSLPIPQRGLGDKTNVLFKYTFWTAKCHEMGITLVNLPHVVRWVPLMYHFTLGVPLTSKADPVPITQPQVFLPAAWTQALWTEAAGHSPYPSLHSFAKFLYLPWLQKPLYRKMKEWVTMNVFVFPSLVFEWNFFFILILCILVFTFIMPPEEMTLEGAPRSYFFITHIYTDKIEVPFSSFFWVSLCHEINLGWSFILIFLYLETVYRNLKPESVCLVPCIEHSKQWQW
jgi:hypothetical protein